MIYNSEVAAQLDLVAYKGDKPTFLIAFWENAGATVPLDLTINGGIIKMQVKKNKHDGRAAITLLVGTGLTIGGIGNNELTIFTDTITAEAGTYYYDIVDTTPEVTIMKGKFIIDQDVTD